jgi:alcohol dehydrogenase class IV
MKPFAHRTQDQAVHFGGGSLGRLQPELARLGCSRPLILTTPDAAWLARDAVQVLGSLESTCFSGAQMHVPAHVADLAAERAAAAGADCTIAVGGGSTLGLGKALALRQKLPMLAVPTTYSGSEMTNIWGITETGAKKTGRSDAVLARAVFYEPRLVATLPRDIALSSLVNAMAHCVEALYADDASPVTLLMAEEGIRALAAAAPGLAREPASQESCTQALYGSWLAGAALNGASMAIHHKLCHTLGGTFGLPHAQTHAAVLPYAVAYNEEAAPQAMERIRRAMPGLDDGRAASSLQRLVRQLGLPTSLREIGMPQDGIDHVLDLALQDRYPNPRPLEREPLRQLLHRAWEGAPA